MKNENNIGPEDSCLICAQKHFLAAEGAIKEPGYEKSIKNHNFAIKELVLAVPHIQQDFPELAQKIRDIRHYVQYWQYGKIGTLWDEVNYAINVAIIKELKIPSSAVDLAPAPMISRHAISPAVHSVPSLPSIPGKSAPSGSSPRTIYVFSNVVYPEKNKITPELGDMLVFLNKAASAGYYRNDRVIRFVYHRSQKDSYGTIVPGCINQYVFDEEKKGNGFPKEFIDRLKKDYDWDYKIEEGKVKCMTTGYMVVKFLEEKYPNHKIVLVNFGYEVNKSTYRCPWHNWEFEAEQLKAFEHLYLEEGKSDDKK